MKKVIFNGVLMDESEAMVSLADRGVQLGLSVFETMLWERGGIDGYRLHLDRMERGLDRMGCGLKLDGERLLADVAKVVEVNGVKKEKLGSSARVRVTAVGEVLMVQAEEFSGVADEVSVLISDSVLNERAASVGVKCGSYADHVLELRAAQKEGADEVIFLNTIGEVAEAAMANVFLVNDGVLITPHLRSGCLPGVTRELVISRSRRAGLEVQECVVLLEDLMDADEVFLTNSVGGVRGVKRIGELVLDEGEITNMIRKIYKDGDQ